MGARRPVLCLGAGFLAGLAMACSRGQPDAAGPRYTRHPPDTRREYVFAVHPLHNPQRLFAIYGPVIDRINAESPGLRFRLEASRDYAAFERKLAGRQVHFALPNPYQTLMSASFGYRVFGKMGDDTQFRGLILVRRDRGIASIQDLKGKTVCYPAPTALAATLLPQYFLQTRGLDLDRDTRTVYVGTQESVILNVHLGLADAGATWPIPWLAFVREHPREARELVVRWQTSALPNNGLVVRDDVPVSVTRRVEHALFSLHQDPEGQRILGQIPLSRFEPASSATYAPVRAFMKRFEARVRSLDG